MEGHTFYNSCENKEVMGGASTSLKNSVVSLLGRSEIRKETTAIELGSLNTVAVTGSWDGRSHTVVASLCQRHSRHG